MISNIQINNINTTLITVPISTNYAITGIFFCNRNLLESDNITLYIVPNGSLVGDDTIIINKEEILPKKTFILSDIEKILLSENDAIIAVCDNEYITATISYMII